MSIALEKLISSTTGGLNSRFNLIRWSIVARFDDLLRSTSALNKTRSRAPFSVWQCYCRNRQQ
jgi:hypothetical protein